MGELGGRIAVVTGAARGLGASVVEAFVREGAKVIATDIRADEGEQLAERLGSAVTFVEHDVTSQEAWRATIERATADVGTVDVLVNNAGIVGFYPVVQTELAEYQRVMDVCATGTYLGIKAVLPGMAGVQRGVIINVASVDAHHGMPGTLPYAAAKHAVLGMTKTVALEMARAGIRSVAVSPGMMMTGMAADAQAGDLGEIDVPAMLACVPMNRFGQPPEVAEVITFLASDRASYITGTDVVVDGGWTSGLPLPPQP